MLFLIVILLLFNILFLKACAPEESATDSSANLQAVLSELDTAKDAQAPNGDAAAAPVVAPNTVSEEPETVNVPENGAVLEAAPTELSNPSENAPVSENAETEPEKTVSEVSAEVSDAAGVQNAAAGETDQ